MTVIAKGRDCINPSPASYDHWDHSADAMNPNSKDGVGAKTHQEEGGGGKKSWGRV